MNRCAICVWIIGVFCCVVTSAEQPDPPASIEIGFHGRRNDPVEGVAVTLENVSDPADVCFAVSNQDGIVRISEVQPGSYQLQAEAKNYVTAESTIVVRRSREIHLSIELVETPDENQHDELQNIVVTPRADRPPPPIPDLVREFTKISNETPDLQELPENDRLHFTGYIRADDGCAPPGTPSRIRSASLHCSTSDYHATVQSVFELLKRSTFPEIIEFPSDSHQTSYHCRIAYSDNLLYTGILLVSTEYREMGRAPQHHHYLLIDNQGKILWEMDHTHPKSSSFPSDSRKYSTVIHVSDAGDTLILGSRQNSGDDMIRCYSGWVTVSSSGQLLAENSTPCRFPLILNEQGRFLLQERSAADKTSTTSYSFSGTRLWSDEKIFPFKTGFFKSPSEEKIMGQLSGGMCVFNSDGHILASVSGYPADDPIHFFDPVWMRNETLFISNGAVYQWDLVPVTAYPDIFAQFCQNHGLFRIQQLVPITEHRYLCAGFRTTGRGFEFHPESQYKFLALLDDQFNVTGIKLFTTPTGTDRFLEIQADPASAEFQIQTCLELITGRVTSSSAAFTDVVFPATPTPEPTWTPRPAREPEPPGHTGRVALKENEFWGTAMSLHPSVCDPDLNTSPDRIEYCVIHIFSDSDPQGIDVVLQEKNANSDVFFSMPVSRNVRLTSGPSVNGRCLHVEDGDLIHAVYEDHSEQKIFTSTAAFHALIYYSARTETEH